MSTKQNKLRLALALILLCLVILLVGRFERPSDGHFQQMLHSAASDPKGFVKGRVNGGIGVALSMDNATSLPKVNMVLPGSPAEIAGLKNGDILLKVNDTSTAGQSLAKVVDSIRGFSAGSVSVTVQRGSTNLSFVIRRGSWNALGETNIFAPNTNPVR